MKISVIVGTVREDRMSERVGVWVMKELQAFYEAEYELLDLKDYPLPFYDEPQLPNAIDGSYKSEVANRWREKIAQADGFIIITSEYNHGVPAVLKNALDYVYNQWNHKAVSFVSYSTGIGAGIRAVEALRLSAINFQMATTQSAIHLPRVQEIIDKDGNLLQEIYARFFPGFMKQLFWWTKLLMSAREPN